MENKPNTNYILGLGLQDTILEMLTPSSVLAAVCIIVYYNNNTQLIRNILK